VNIRLADAGDVAVLHRLLTELAAFEGGTVEAGEADLLRDGFGARPLFEALLAEVDGRAVGLLVFLPLYSSWRGRPALLLHDLYVSGEARGAGVGKALVVRLAEIARERGCCRVDVQVLDWNERARAFYESLGFGWNRGWLGYRLALS
jgi:GNAT superfamily N-acetyltransferase